VPRYFRVGLLFAGMMLCALLLGPAPAQAGGGILVSSFTGPASGTVGQPLTLTATINQTSGTDTVDVRENVTEVSPPQTLLSGSHSYQYVVTPTTAGSHTYQPARASGTDLFISGGHTATVTVGKASTTTSLSASTSAPTSGQSVTFTATVSGFAPTGTVTFMDGAATLGTASLSGGVATFSTAALSPGSHSITAVYGGDSNNTGSTSSAATATVAQASTIPPDSALLRALQLGATKVVGQNSGQAITGAIDNAISDGFSGGGGPVTPGGTGLHFSFAADPDRVNAIDGERVVSERWNGTLGRDGAVSGDGTNAYVRGRQSSTRTDDAFAAIDRNGMATKAPPLRALEPKDWMLWADVRGAGIDRWNSTPGNPPAQLSGSQVNALLGLTRRVTPSLLVGVVGGYETFDYTSQDINGKLKGNGWTVGSYLGWKLSPAIRFDAAVAYSGIGYEATAATAGGNFDGRRWLLSSGLSGDYKAYSLDIEPSARVYALWEHENAYTDSLGTHQADRDFATGRASGGVKLSYPFGWSERVTLAPYAGLYGDYYFTHDNAAAILAAGGIPLASTPFLDGWSARATTGLAAQFSSGAIVALGGEYGGIGNNVHIWTFHVRAAAPF
jgi:Autotransporter beta-domain/Bacterial Ig-like domain (group 3)